MKRLLGSLEKQQIKVMLGHKVILRVWMKREVEYQIIMKTAVECPRKAAERGRVNRIVKQVARDTMITFDSIQCFVLQCYREIFK